MGRPGVDVGRVLETFRRHGVEYLVVGGVAAWAHGAERFTEDLDCLIERSRENTTRVAAAMRELNARLRVEGLSDEQSKLLPVVADERMISKMGISTWRTDAGALDLLADIPARDGERLDFNKVAQRSRVVGREDLTIRVAGLADIIASKEWADRPKDHDALPELRALGDPGPSPAGPGAEP